MFAALWAGIACADGQINVPATDEQRMTHPDPVIERALRRREMRAAAPRIVSQSIIAGQLVSRLEDGSIVVAPLRKVCTARAPEAFARARRDRALARIIAAVDDARDPEKTVEALERIAEQAEKKRTAGGGAGGNNTGAVAGVAGIAVASAAAAYAAGRLGRKTA